VCNTRIVRARMRKPLIMGSKRIAMTEEEETGKTRAQIVGGSATILLLGGALGTVILGTLGQILAALGAITYFILAERK